MKSRYKFKDKINFTTKCNFCGYVFVFMNNSKTYAVNLTKFNFIP